MLSCPLAWSAHYLSFGSVQRAEESDVLFGRELVIQGELLRDIAYVLLPLACAVLTIIGNASRIIREESEYTSHRSAFSCAVRSEDTVYLAFLDFKRQPVDGIYIFEAFFQLFDLKYFNVVPL